LANETEKNRINFIIPVWGEKYINTFINYCLPSLASLNNFQSLDKSSGHKLFICTDRKGSELIIESSIFNVVCEQIETDIVLIDNILAEITSSGGKHREDYNYRRMTAAHNEAIQRTDRRTACSFIMPDNIVYDGFISDLLGYLNSKSSILMYSFAVDMEKSRDRLKDYFGEDGVFSIENRKLCGIALDCLHHSTKCSFIESENFLPNGNIHMKSGESSAVARLSYLHPILVVPEKEMPLIPGGTTFDDGGFFKNAVGEGQVVYPENSDELIMFALDEPVQKSYLQNIRTGEVNFLELAVRIRGIDEEYLNNLRRYFIYNPDKDMAEDVSYTQELINILFIFIKYSKSFDKYLNYHEIKMAVLAGDDYQNYFKDFIKNIDKFVESFLQEVEEQTSQRIADYYKENFKKIKRSFKTDAPGRLDILKKIREALIIVGSLPLRPVVSNCLNEINPENIRKRLMNLNQIISNDKATFLYGFGDESRVYISLLKETDKIIGILDDNKEKIGNIYKNIECFGLDEEIFLNKNKKQVIIMSPRYSDNIALKLDDLKLKGCTVYRWGEGEKWTV